MGLYPALRLFTPEEYLTIERAANSKSEYLDGRIYARPGANRGHDRVAVNVLTSLQMRLHGKGCRAHSNGLRVSLTQRGPYFYSDVTVVCAEEPDWQNDMIGEAIVVCEVLSEATARYDQEVKLEQYRLTPSVREILMIAQDKVEVQHHFRQQGQMWDVRFYDSLAGSIPLSTLGIDLPIARVYAGMGFK